MKDGERLLEIQEKREGLLFYEDGKCYESENVMWVNEAHVEDDFESQVLFKKYSGQLALVNLSNVFFSEKELEEKLGKEAINEFYLQNFGYKVYEEPSHD